MKRSLLASTAMGTLMAATSFAHAEGLGLRVFGGLNIASDNDFSGFIGTYTTTSGGSFATVGLLGDFEFDADLGYVFGGAVGYGWDNGFSIDIEAAYRRNKLDIRGIGDIVAIGTTKGGDPFTSTKFDTSGTISGTDGHLEAISVMANAWYEFDLGNSPVRPFVGGGVGIAWLDLHDIVEARFVTGTYTFEGSSGLHGDDSGFAWQLGAGLNWEIAPDKDFTLEYRYFNGPELETVRVHDLDNDISLDYEAHSVMAGFKVGW